MNLSVYIKRVYRVYAGRTMTSSRKGDLNLLTLNFSTGDRSSLQQHPFLVDVKRHADFRNFVVFIFTSIKLYRKFFMFICAYAIEMQSIADSLPEINGDVESVL